MSDDEIRELREVELEREQERLRKLREAEAEAEKRARDRDAAKSLLCTHGRIRGDCPEC